MREVLLFSCLYRAEISIIGDPEVGNIRRVESLIYGEEGEEVIDRPRPEFRD